MQTLLSLTAAVFWLVTAVTAWLAIREWPGMHRPGERQAATVLVLAMALVSALMTWGAHSTGQVAP